MRILLLFCALFACFEARATDFAVSIFIEKPEAKKRDTISGKIILLNQGKMDGSGIGIQIAFSDGLRIITQNAGLGSFNLTSGMWLIEKCQASTLESSLRFEIVVQEEGPLAVQAEITRLNEQDSDSTPGNAKIGEDDLVFAYVTVPIVFCGNEVVRLTAEAYPGFEGYQWFFDGKKIDGAAQRQLTITKVGRYTCEVMGQTNSFPVIVEQRPAMTLDLGGTKQVCVGKNLKIAAKPKNAAPPINYEWSNDKGIDLDTPLKATSELVLTVVATDRFGCKISDSVKVDVVDCKK